MLSSDCLVGTNMCSESCICCHFGICLIKVNMHCWHQIPGIRVGENQHEWTQYWGSRLTWTIRIFQVPGLLLCPRNEQKELSYRDP